MKRSNRFLPALVAIATVNIAYTVPSLALELELDDSKIEFSEDDSKIRPSVSTDNDQINIEVYEQPEPNNRIEIEDGDVTLEQEQKPDRELIELSVPVE